MATREVITIGPQTPTRYDDLAPRLLSPRKKKTRRKRKKKRPSRANSSQVDPAAPIVRYVPPFFVEGGGLGEDELRELPQFSAAQVVDDVFDIWGKDNDYLYYKEAFVGQPHHHFMGRLANGQPMVASLVLSGDTWIAMIRTPAGTQRLQLPVETVDTSFLRKLARKGPDPRAVLVELRPELALLPPRQIRQVNDSPELQAKLLDLEARQAIKGFKFGVVLAREDQVREDDFFCNTEATEAFDEFLDFLGDRVDLLGWDQFSGGLDTRNNSTGTQSVYTRFREQPVMFHVSTMLPFSASEKQQLERKRHIGNDLVVIVFQDATDTLYRPQSLSSRMIHAVILIRPVRVPNDPAVHYRMAVVSKDKMMPTAPQLPNYSVHKRCDKFRELLFCKLLNSERAAYQAPILSDKLGRTRNALLNHVSEGYLR